jgi:small subunit ribosomal protein S24e
MKLEIKEKKENKLLGRTEVEGVVTFEGATPSNEVMQEALKVELKADKGLIIIKHIHSRFSYQEADFLVYIYDNKEAMEKTEVMTKHLKKKAEAEKKKAEEGAAEKAEEPKVEEKPEEVKEEKKAEDKSEEEKPKEAPAEETKEESK